MTKVETASQACLTPAGLLDLQLREGEELASGPGLWLLGLITCVSKGRPLRGNELSEWNSCIPAMFKMPAMLSCHGGCQSGGEGGWSETSGFKSLSLPLLLVLFVWFSFILMSTHQILNIVAAAITLSKVAWLDMLQFQRAFPVIHMYTHKRVRFVQIFECSHALLWRLGQSR